jgi:anti-sigma B factor antagonist
MVSPSDPSATRVELSRTDGDAVVSVSGELDGASSVELRDLLVRLAHEPPGRVLVDLSQTDFIDSTGVGVLLGGLQRMQAVGSTLALAHVPPRLSRVFEVAGLAEHFPRVD